MLKWKGEVLSKYEEIIYLDGNSGKISEDTFIHRVVAERRGFYMSVASATPKYITIRLFSDAEQRAATTTKK